LQFAEVRVRSVFSSKDKMNIAYTRYSTSLVNIEGAKLGERGHVY